MPTEADLDAIRSPQPPDHTKKHNWSWIASMPGEGRLYLRDLSKISNCAKRSRGEFSI